MRSAGRFRRLTGSRRCITGYETSAAAAVREAGSLSRSAIRGRFEERFTARRMAEDYIRLYRRLIDGKRARPRLRMV
jgi:hypothetical protein